MITNENSFQIQTDSSYLLHTKVNLSEDVFTNENLMENPHLETSQEALLKSTHSESETESAYMCRICHCEEKADETFISPCNCNGSLNFVHQACLQKWLHITGSKSCELCNYNFELVKKFKPLSSWEHLEMPRSEKTKIILSITLYIIAIIINSWSFATFWNITIFYFKNNRFNWTFISIILVLCSSFICILSFVVFLIQIFYSLLKRYIEHNRYVLVKSLNKECIDI